MVPGAPSHSARRYVFDFVRYSIPHLRDIFAFRRDSGQAHRTLGGVQAQTRPTAVPVLLESLTSLQRTKSSKL